MTLSTTARYFVDTNVLVYAFDAAEPTKQAIARTLLESVPPGTLVISTQVIQELASVAFKKHKGDPETVRRILEIRRLFKVVTLELSTVMQAIELAMTAQLSLWDALILSAAHAAECDVLLTEDLNAGQVVQGVRIVNPFSNDANA